jgi:hypothetical protein
LLSYYVKQDQRTTAYHVYDRDVVSNMSHQA